MEISLKSDFELISKVRERNIGICGIMHMHIFMLTLQFSSQEHPQNEEKTFLHAKRDYISLIEAR